MKDKKTKRSLKWVKFIYSIFSSFWPPINISLPSLIAKLAFCPPNPTYYFKLNETGNKLEINLKEFDDIYYERIFIGRRWKRYQRMIDRANSTDLIDVFHSDTDRGNRITCLFWWASETYNSADNTFSKISSKYTILYSHGNGCDLGIIIGIIYGLRRKTNCNVFAFDYSGYGLSSGKPSEANLYSDLESAVLSLNSRYNIRPQNIILFGHSIGSVPTIDLSSRMNFAGVVLSASFMSGIRCFYPYKRRTWLFDPFPNIEKVHRIKSPVLVIHGTRDTTIDIYHSYALYNRCKFKVEPLWVKDAAHDNVRLYPGYYERLQKFINTQINAK